MPSSCVRAETDHGGVGIAPRLDDLGDKKSASIAAAAAAAAAAVGGAASGCRRVAVARAAAAAVAAADASAAAGITAVAAGAADAAAFGAAAAALGTRTGRAAARVGGQDWAHGLISALAASAALGLLSLVCVWIRRCRQRARREQIDALVLLEAKVQASTAIEKKGKRYSSNV